MTETGLPLVSVIVPIRNEADFIERCLEQIAVQTYPQSRIEIFVVDGESDDGTIEIVERFAASHPNVHLLSNPDRIVPTALNIGLTKMTGEIFLRVDGHCDIDERFIEESVALLQTTNAWCVGGAITTIAQGSTGEAIAIAQSSPFGVGSATFRTGVDGDDSPKLVDTLAFGAYWRSHLDEIGWFDEELVRNQDDELNFRLTQAGGTILLSPRIKSDYHARSSFKKLARQYYQYGFWKVRVMQKRKAVAAPRQLVPITLVGAIAGSGLLSALTRKPLFLGAVLVPYAAGCSAGSVIETMPDKIKLAPQVAAAFATMHLSYGVGFARGLKHFGIKPADHVPTAMSR